MSSTAPAKVAVIGGGMAGLSAARELTRRGAAVTVFDKGYRGPGGRLASRPRGGTTIDHGAPCFRAQHPEFVALLTALESAGHVARWRPRVTCRLPVTAADAAAATACDATAPLKVQQQRALGTLSAAGDGELHWLGTARMSSLPAALAEGLDVRLGTRVDRVSTTDSASGLVAAAAAAAAAPADHPAHSAHEAAPRRLQLTDDAGGNLGEFDGVVLAAPAAQTSSLLSAAFPKTARVVKGFPMSPSWALLLEWDVEPTLMRDSPADVYCPTHGDCVGKVLRNHRKPGRADTPPTWVVNTRCDWSRANVNVDAAAAAAGIMAALEQLGVMEGGKLAWHAAHRWRYALPTADAGTPVMSPAPNVAVCGDWLADTPQFASPVESAWVSGRAAAGALLQGRMATTTRRDTLEAAAAPVISAL